MGIATLISDRFLRNFTCGRKMELRICTHKISEAHRLLALRKPFITEFFKEPRRFKWTFVFHLYFICVYNSANT